MKSFKMLAVMMTAFLWIVFVAGGAALAQESTAPPLLSGSQLGAQPAPPAPAPAAAPLLAPPPQGVAAPPPPPPGAPAPPPPPGAATPPPPPPAPGAMAPLPGPGAPAPPLAFLRKGPQAVKSAKAARAMLTAGKVWPMRAPGGETILKAAIVYQGMAVGVLEFSPLDGALLPKGYKPRVYTPAAPPVVERVERELAGIMSRLEVLNGAEFRAPEAAWVVPLAVDGMIVSHLKVYYDGVHIVPDFPANQEMQVGVRP